MDDQDDKPQVVGLTSERIISDLHKLTADLSQRPKPAWKISDNWPTVIFVAALSVACLYGLWLSHFRFDHIDLDNGESYPVRINRLTSNSEVLYRGAWIPSSLLPKLAPPIQDLNAQDLEKLKGEAKLEFEVSFLDLNLYNGSDFALKEITVEVVITESSAKEVMRRAYRIEKRHPAKQQMDYSQMLGFSLGPGQNWAWKIIAARGTKR
jgi:hypothetical protein